MKKTFKFAAAALVVLAAVYANNTNRLAAHRNGTPVPLAHCGIAQRFDERDLKNDTCTAARMLLSGHDYLLLINVKSRDAGEGEKLAAVLSTLAAARRAQIMVYGGDEPVEVLRRLLSDTRTISRAAIKSCLLGYIGYGWTGVVPTACRNAMVMLPINVAPWMWVVWSARADDRHPEVLASSASLEGWQPVAHPSRRARARTSG